jgi:hypothetical protein
MASIGNDAQGCFGVQGGHRQKTLSLAGRTVRTSTEKRPVDAPAGAVIGVPGKAEHCGSNNTCVLLDSAKKACLRQACALQGRGRGGLTARTARTARKEEQRRMAPRARCWRVHSALTPKANAIEAINDRLHAACERIQSGQLPVLA